MNVNGETPRFHLSNLIFLEKGKNIEPQFMLMQKMLIIKPIRKRTRENDSN
jgi:hypothetical protein